MSHSSEPTNPDVAVTLKLPPDLIAQIRQRAGQLQQSPTTVMIEALRAGLCADPVSSNPVPSNSSNPVSSEVEELRTRLLSLEALIPRVTALEEQVNHLSAPSPRSVPASMPQSNELEARPTAAHCPSCEASLGPPLRSSGRQVCRKCGWSNKPRRTTAEADLPVTDDLQTLLAQATTEALNNMTPKAPGPGASLRNRLFPPRQ